MARSLFGLRKDADVRSTSVVILAGMNGNPFGGDAVSYGVSAAGFYSTTGLFKGEIS